MPVIAVINRKGGSGKSTLATHLAAYCAATGKRVMLGDVDRQQSAQTWLRLRGAQNLPNPSSIQGWALDPKNVLRAPAGVTHIVLDTPGGMRGFELARIVMNADAILMPVCNSIFDRESAAECFAELKTMPRIASGRCKVGAIGMRLDARTKADAVLAEWARKLELPFIGVLRETQAYVRCIENGLTLFDLPKTQVQADLAQWKSIAMWLEGALRAPDAAAAAKPAAANEVAAPTRATAPASAPKPQQAATPLPPKPLPAQLLASHANDEPRETPAAPKPVPRIDRAPQGELAHAGTLASIGELARTLKAADVKEPAAAPRSPRTPGADASADLPAVPLRPTRPIVPSTGRSPLAAARQAASKATPPAGTSAAPASLSSPHNAAPATLSARSRAAITRPEPTRSALGSRLGQLLDTLPLPRFLQRNS